MVKKISIPQEYKEIVERVIRKNAPGGSAIRTFRKDVREKAVVILRDEPSLPSEKFEATLEIYANDEKRAIRLSDYNNKN